MKGGLNAITLALRAACVRGAVESSLESTDAN